VLATAAGDPHNADLAEILDAERIDQLLGRSADMTISTLCNMTSLSPIEHTPG